MSLERQLIEVPTTKCWYWFDNPRLAYIAGQTMDKLTAIQNAGIPLTAGLEGGGMVINPLHVRPRGASYQVFIGNRRLAAAKGVKLPTIPVLLYPNITEDEMWDLAVQESAISETKNWSTQSKQFGMAQVMKCVRRPADRPHEAAAAPEDIPAQTELDHGDTATRTIDTKEAEKIARDFLFPDGELTDEASDLKFDVFLEDLTMYADLSALETLRPAAQALLDALTAEGVIEPYSPDPNNAVTASFLWYRPTRGGYQGDTSTGSKSVKTA